jgi:hypothetical protein
MRSAICRNRMAWRSRRSASSMAGSFPKPIASGWSRAVEESASASRGRPTDDRASIRPKSCRRGSSEDGLGRRPAELHEFWKLVQFNGWRKHRSQADPLPSANGSAFGTDGSVSCKRPSVPMRTHRWRGRTGVSGRTHGQSLPGARAPGRMSLCCRISGTIRSSRNPEGRCSWPTWTSNAGLPRGERRERRERLVSGHARENGDADRSARRLGSGSCR